MNFHSHKPAHDPLPLTALTCEVKRGEAPIVTVPGLNCQEYARLAVAAMDQPRTRDEQLGLAMHAAVCGVCQAVSWQFKVISELIHEIADPAPTNSANQSAADRVARRVRALLENEAATTKENEPK